jgi:hypothetical protein
MSELIEIRTLLSEQGRTLGRVEGTLAEMSKALEAGKKDSEHIEGRLRKVENRQHWYAGGAAVIGAIIAFIFDSHR